MPIIKSAKKRVRTARKATVRNSKTKRSLKEAVKAFSATVAGGKDSKKAQAAAQGAIDTAVKKGVMHKNKAARKKAQLAKQAKAAAGTKKTVTKKTAAKKTVAKKTPAKKPAAKKAAAKK